MAAATADRLIVQKEAGEKSYPMLTNVKIYAGTLVCVDTAGYAKAAADGAGLKVVGVADVTVDNTGGASGDKSIKVRRGVFKLPAASITQAMVGKLMYVVDDQTVDDAKGTNGVKAGRLVEFLSTTEGWIEILGGMGVGAVVADADATYGQPEADLINELKTIINTYLA
jgi:predicted RecA/RadA family phage recombinase